MEPNSPQTPGQRPARRLATVSPVLFATGSWLRHHLDPPELSYVGTYWLLMRALGAVYTVAFLGLALQLRPLLGDNGLLPVSLFLERVAAGSDTPWLQVPSLMWLGHSDGFMLSLAWIGVALSLALVAGYIHVVQMLVLWMLYSSFVNVGQLFWGYGWEILLLEVGFLSLFMVHPSKAILWLLRWVLFRIMFGAGLIKLRGDACWWDLTCLLYHYETQPIPNPLSPFFHALPNVFHKAGVLFNHLVEVAAPFLLIGPPRIRWLAGGLMLAFQVLLILSGNLCWLNYITVVLCISCFDDRVWQVLFGRLDRLSRWWSLTVAAQTGPTSITASRARRLTVGGLCLLVAYLSIGPVGNLLSTRQAMNTSFDRLHLVNTYGAFGHIGKVRREIILLGTVDPNPGPASDWVEYEFECKPGDPDRRPCVVSPYHLRLDWQIWFAAMSDYRSQPWFVHFVYKLLHADADALGLLDADPFDGQRPTAIRADLYEYHLAPLRSEAFWQRQRVGVYLPMLRADDPQLRQAIKGLGWPLLSSNAGTESVRRYTGPRRSEPPAASRADPAVSKLAGTGPNIISRQNRSHHDRHFPAPARHRRPPG